MAIVPTFIPPSAAAAAGAEATSRDGSTPLTAETVVTVVSDWIASLAEIVSIRESALAVKASISADMRNGEVRATLLRDTNALVEPSKATTTSRLNIILEVFLVVVVMMVVVEWEMSTKHGNIGPS